MGESTITLIAVGVIITALAILGITAFTRLHAADRATRTALSGIDAILQQRAELLDAIAAVMDKAAGQAVSAVEKARQAAAYAVATDNVEHKAAAEDCIRRNLGVAFADADGSQSTPELRRIHDQLSAAAEELSFACAFYNDDVRELNALVKSVPWMFFSGFAGVKPRCYFPAQGGPAASPGVECH